MKKASVFVLLTLMCAVMCSCDYSDYDWDFPLAESNEALIAEADEESTPPEDYTDTLMFVMNEIGAVTDTAEYQRASEKKRVYMVQPVIKRLYDDGYISKYEFHFGKTDSYISYDFSAGGMGRVEIKVHKHWFG